MIPEAGKTYDINHRRKGKFRVAVSRVDDVWVNGTLVDGSPHNISMTAAKAHVGDPMTLRIEFCEFEEIEGQDK